MINKCFVLQVNIKVFKVIDTIGQANETMISKSKTQGKFLQLLRKVAVGSFESTTATNSSFSYSGKAIAFVSTTASTENTDDPQEIIVINDILEDTFDVIVNSSSYRGTANISNIAAKIGLPKEVFTTDYGESGYRRTTQFYSYAYKSSVFFNQRANDKSAELNSIILSASIRNRTIKNLNESIQLEFDVRKTKGNNECAFWRFENEGRCFDIHHGRVMT